MIHKIACVTPNEHRFSIEYRRLVHWSYNHRSPWQFLRDHFWFTWSVRMDFDQGSVVIQHGSESLFFPRKKMRSILKNVVDNWEKEWAL